MREDAALKHYEVDFAPKERAYSAFMVAFQTAVSDVAARDQQGLVNQIFQMESALSSLEPFLTKKARDEIRAKYERLIELCYAQIKRPADQTEADKNAFLTEASSAMLSIKDQLYNTLFAND